MYINVLTIVHTSMYVNVPLMVFTVAWNLKGTPEGERPYSGTQREGGIRRREGQRGKSISMC